ncbi:MAG: sulfur carrier protein ThiS [Bacteroides sp.]|nr:sulfur carrier protein ThiS [Bacteroides sp.]
MKIKINNKEVEAAVGTTLAELLEQQSVPAAGIATAVNGVVVPASARVSHPLADGDSIVVIKAFYGG